MPRAFARDEPDAWRTVDGIESQGVRGTDTCVIDGRCFYVRGRILVPIIGLPEPLIWGLWVEVSQDSFKRFGELWDVALREHEPPMPGQLANDIPVYPRTIGLPCRLVLKNARRRPSIEIEAGDHPLAIEQYRGITLDRIEEIASQVLQHSGHTDSWHALANSDASPKRGYSAAVARFGWPKAGAISSMKRCICSRTKVSGRLPKLK